MSPIVDCQAKIMCERFHYVSLLGIVVPFWISCAAVDCDPPTKYIAGSLWVRITGVSVEWVGVAIVTDISRDWLRKSMR